MRTDDASEQGAYAGLATELRRAQVSVETTGSDWCPVCGKCYTPRIAGRFGDYEITAQHCNGDLSQGVNGVWALHMVVGGHFKQLYTTDRADLRRFLQTQVDLPGAPKRTRGVTP